MVVVRGGAVVVGAGAVVVGASAVVGVEDGGGEPADWPSPSPEQAAVPTTRAANTTRSLRAPIPRF